MGSNDHACIGEKAALWQRHCIFKAAVERAVHIDDAQAAFARSEQLKDDYIILTDDNTRSIADLLEATVLIHPNNLELAFTGLVLRDKDSRKLVTAMHCLDFENPDYVTHKDMLTNVSTLKEEQQERVILEVVGKTFRQNPVPLNSMAVLFYTASFDYVVFEYKGTLRGIELDDLQLSWPCKSVALGFPAKYHSIWTRTQKPLMSVGLCSPFDTRGGMHRFEPDFEEKAWIDVHYTGRVAGGFSGGPIFSERRKLIGMLHATPCLDEDHPIYNDVSLIEYGIRKDPPKDMPRI